MSATIWEKENTFKSTVEWLSGSTYVDPSANKSFINVYDPDGTLYISHSGIRDSTGVYHYYISTQSNAELGLWKIQWHGYFNYESPFSFLKKSETEVIQLVDVEMT